MRKHLKIAFVFLAITAAVLPFQNCGSDFNPDEYSSAQLSSTGAPIPPSAGAAPKITSTSNPGTVGFFNAATLGIVASGDNLSYQWYKDGTLLNGANGSTYAISSAAAVHQGVYSVVVSNPYGQVSSVGLALNVVRLPEQAGAPVIVAKTANQILPFLSSVQVPLSVTASGYGLSYSWALIAPDAQGKLQTTAIPGNVNQIMTTVTNYAVQGQTYSYVNVGTYRVTVTNAFGESTVANIIVEFEPFQFSF